MALGDASVEANISENVADIYQDLKDFILSYRIGTVEVMRAALGVPEQLEQCGGKNW